MAGSHYRFISSFGRLRETAGTRRHHRYYDHYHDYNHRSGDDCTPGYAYARRGGQFLACR
jgi:hypothetical protein